MRPEMVTGKRGERYQELNGVLLPKENYNINVHR